MRLSQCNIAGAFCEAANIVARDFVGNMGI
jgi:hypothetical protein